MTIPILTRAQIDAICPGWSSEKHWAFFEHLLGLPNVKDILMLGVYCGRDLAYLSAIARGMGKAISLAGVDTFTDTPGADWQPHQQNMTWQQAHGVESPTLEKAIGNLHLVNAAAILCKATAQEYLKEFAQQFDAIYIDTSHDYETTRDCIALALPRLRPGGVLCGDDYSDEGTWGVKRAVSERFPDGRHKVFSGWIWMAKAEDAV